MFYFVLLIDFDMSVAFESRLARSRLGLTTRFAYLIAGDSGRRVPPVPDYASYSIGAAGVQSPYGSLPGKDLGDKLASLAPPNAKIQA